MQIPLSNRRLITLIVSASLTLVAQSGHAQQTGPILSCAADAATGDTATPLVVMTDASWTMSNDGGTTWVPAFIGYQHPAWVTPQAGSSWLSPGLTSPAIPTPAPIQYRSPIITIGPNVDPASVAVSFEYAVDNYLDSAQINNVSTAFTGLAGYSAYQTAVSLPAGATSGWISGNNYFSLTARNAEPQHPPPTGVLATVTLTANCIAPTPQIPVPSNSPIALLLAALALTGLGVRQWKSRQR